MQMISLLFANEGAIPSKYTGDGDNASPALEWGAMPKNAKALALICEDPDAPMGTFTHWVVYDLPATLTSLEEGVGRQERLTCGGCQGRNSFGHLGYDGPCPPPGCDHRYYFTLYALDAPLGLAPNAEKGAVIKAMKGHIIAEAQTMGRYRRSKAPAPRANKKPRPLGRGFL